MTEPGGRVTIADIALHAGVSVPTVSKVLNDRADVSADTRSKVQRALAEHGYRRRPATGRTRSGLVDLVFWRVDSPWAMEVMRGAELAAHHAGVGLVVSRTHDGGDDEQRWLQTLARRRSDGLVLVVSELTAGTAEQLSALHTPLVLLDSVGGSDPGLPTVGATNWAGGLEATEHLLGLGHRRIGMVVGRPDLQCSQQRHDGYRAALGRAGVPVDEALVRAGDFRPEGGRRAAAELLSLPDPPTAVFAGSDLQAVGVYEEARARGLSVPHDLSVVGFDDVAVCEWMSPSLTTVRQPLSEMAGEAVRLALRDDRHSAAPVRLEMATSLVLRASTAPPRPPG